MVPRSRFALAAALLLGAVLLAPSAPAAAAERHVDVAALPVGDAPRIDRLTGRILHPASGATVRIPVAREHQNSLELLGRVFGGWLVAHHWSARMLLVSPEGGIARRIPYGHYEEYPGNASLHLAASGDRVLLLTGDRADETDARILDLRGRKRAERHLADHGSVVATRGRTFYLGLQERLVSWRAGTRPETVTDAEVAALDLRRGLLVRVDAGSGEEGVATVRDPERVRWTLPRPVRYAPKVFAPGGRHLVTTRGARGVLVYASGRGALTTELRFSEEVRSPAVWEDRGHVLVEVVRGEQHTLVRCGLRGECVRTVPWQAHPLLGWDYSRTG